MGKIIITGGHGFIGSNLVRYLYDRGLEDIIVVDSNDNGYLKKYPNVKCYSVEEFTLKILTAHKDKKTELNDIDVVFHLGAIVDTTSKNEKIIDYNLTFSKCLTYFCSLYDIPLLYASSAATYGINRSFKEDEEDLHPLNLYGQSKYDFDMWLKTPAETNKSLKVFGFRFFNVYGPNEFHKRKMASAITQLYVKGRFFKNISLFKSIDINYKDGEQARDFIYVDYVLSTLYYFYLNRENIPSGIYNLGTGKAMTFLDIANAVKKSYHSRFSNIKISFIDMPNELKSCYQSFTQADMTKTNKYSPINYNDDNAIYRYYEYLNKLPDKTFTDLRNKIYK